MLEPNTVFKFSVAPAQYIKYTLDRNSNFGIQQKEKLDIVVLIHFNE